MIWRQKFTTWFVITVAVWLVPSAESDIDESTKLGSCGLPVPIGFTCKDLPEYRSFLEQLQENARNGFPKDGGLLKQAHNIVARWQAKTYVDHPPEGFYKYLCGAKDWPLPDNMCLFGFVSAMLIRARHLIGGDAEETFQAKLDLEYGTTVLGNELCLDFMDASPWPVSVLDLYVNMNQTEFMTNAMYTKNNPIRPPVISFEQIQWRPKASAVVSKAGAQIPSEISAIVLGSHATLSMEPVEMIKRFVPDVSLRAIFVGIEPRWCQILGACNQGAPELASMVKASEADPYAYPWAVMVDKLGKMYDSDKELGSAALLICTEPMAVCLMLKHVARVRGRHLPVLGYMGVALLNGCPPEDIDTFWDSFKELLDGENVDVLRTPSVLAVNNMILSEQIYYQTGERMPYVRAHGLYTGASYIPIRSNEILMWRAPLFLFATLRCAMQRFQQALSKYPMQFKFLDDSEHISWKDAAHFRAIVLLPWDHALMTFYELYSANVPLLLPNKDMMYRLIYQRGQLSVGERWYQSAMPGHQPPFAEFEEPDDFGERSEAPNNTWGLSAAKAARGAAEHMLLRALNATDLHTTKEMVSGALSLVKDMAYFLAVSSNQTETDSFTSMGVVRGVRPSGKSITPRAPRSEHQDTSSYHPYTPFQMSNRDSNDWTRKRMGGWWLRRGVRYDAMRYWYQFSDFARLPGLRYFDNLVELICMSQQLDTHTMNQEMQRYNGQSLIHSVSFWSSAVVELLSDSKNAYRPS